MKKRIFVDTAALIALADKKDSFHDQFLELFSRCAEDGCVLFTTDYILDELLTFMRCNKKEPVERIISFINGIYVSEVEILEITRDIFGSALRLMRKYKDQYFSFTDCVSFVVMKDLKIGDVLTTDRHFSIAGFNNLFKI